jgi:hypothetical protein
MRDDGSDFRLPQAATKERDLVARQLARAPLPGRLGEDLQRLAATRLGAIDGARQSTRDRQVCTQARHQ